MANIYLYPLVSGGPDSFVALCLAIEKYNKNIKAVIPVFIDRSFDGSGHRALEREKEANKIILKQLDEKYKDIKFYEVEQLKIPFEWYVKAKKENDKVFPYGRNLIFISVTAAKIATDFQKINRYLKDEGVIITGFHMDDENDAGRHFLNHCNRTLVSSFGQWNILQTIGRALIRLEAPLIESSFNKDRLIKWVKENNTDFILENSWSCYNGNKKPCGSCVGCAQRAKAFKDAGIKDPSI